MAVFRRRLALLRLTSVVREAAKSGAYSTTIMLEAIFLWLILLFHIMERMTVVGCEFLFFFYRLVFLILSSHVVVRYLILGEFKKLVPLLTLVRLTSVTAFFSLVKARRHLLLLVLLLLSW